MDSNVDRRAIDVSISSQCRRKKPIKLYEAVSTYYNFHLAIYIFSSSFSSPTTCSLKHMQTLSKCSYVVCTHQFIVAAL